MSENLDLFKKINEIRFRSIENKLNDWALDNLEFLEYLYDHVVDNELNITFEEFVEAAFICRK
jgi:hypothetical protein